MPPTKTERSRLTVEDLVNRFRGDMVPLGGKFSYFTVMPLADEDLKQYLDEPIAALPSAIGQGLQQVGLLLVPYLEKANGKGGDIVTYDRPHENRQMVASRYVTNEAAALVFAIKDEDVSDYHYSFYNSIASLVVRRWPPDTQESY